MIRSPGDNNDASQPAANAAIGPVVSQGIGIPIASRQGSAFQAAHWLKTPRFSALSAPQRFAQALAIET